EAAKVQCRHIFKSAALRLDIGIVCRGGRVVREACEREIFPYDDQTLRIGEWQRPKQHRIDQTENGRVCADSQRDRYQSNGGEPWTAPQHSKPMTNIAYQILQPRKTALTARSLHPLTASPPMTSRP